MWVKPDYQSEITSVDNLIDTTQPITYSGSATNGTLTINFTTMDGVAQTMNDMTFAKQFQIWNTNLWDKPNNDPSYYADPNNVNDFWSQLINYNQTVPTPGGHGQSYLWETNISQQAFQSAFSGSPDFSGTSDDSDTLQVTFGNMWKYIPSFLWRQITPDDADRANVTITSTNFAPTESIHESFQNDKQSYIQNNVAYIVKDKYHAIVIAGVKNDAGDTAQWFYSYNGVENNTTPPDGVTVSAGNPYTQDDVTYYPMTYTLTNDIQSDFSFVVWSKAGTHGSLADGLQITATTTPPTPAHNSSSQVGIIVGSILGGSLVIAGGTVGTIYIKRRRGSSGTKSESRKTKRQRATDFNE
jgi:hypothetical protein